MPILKVYDGPENDLEEILEPGLPIVDAHHHIWPEGSPIADYTVGDLLRRDVLTGHNVVATVFAECMAAYREGGDEASRPVGETEFVVDACPLAPNRPRIAAGIIGWAELRQPAIAARTLDLHAEAGQGRFKGVRYNAYWHANQDHFTSGPRSFPRHLLLDPTFREGLREVDRRGLTYDVWMYSGQLADLAETADAFPNLTMVLCHMGGPVTDDHTPEGRRRVFDEWRVLIADVARRPNVHLKVGGMGMPHFGFPYDENGRRPTGEEIAAMWRPYFEVAVRAFGPDRCMFESNFPPDKNGYSYVALWNALKLLSKAYSHSERNRMFVETASRVYKLDLKLP